MLKISTPVSVLLAGIFFISAGCADSSKPATVSAKGSVTYKKTKPAAGALIVFHPSDPALEKKIGGKPFATVKEDGTYVLTSYAEGDGAPEGEYGVTIQWQAKAKEGKLSLGSEGGGGGASLINQAKYGNPQQPFQKVTVKKGDNNEFTFDVD